VPLRLQDRRPRGFRLPCHSRICRWHTPIPTLPPSRGKGIADGFDYPFQIFDHLLIAEAKDLVALASEPGVPHGVTFLDRGQAMRIAIDFDN
jgi:hypothetical protein